MSSYSNYRTVHKWAGLILLIPICVIAATGFLWNHEKSLGIKAEEPEDGNKKHSQTMTRGPNLMANYASLSAAAGPMALAVEAACKQWGGDVSLDRIELKDEPGAGLVVKVKISEELNLLPYEIVWSVAESRVIERKGDPKAGTDWAKIVHDLHTGKFFNRKYGFIWSDSSAIALLLLGTTGLVLYVIPVLKKRSKKNGQKSSTSLSKAKPSPLPATIGRPAVRPVATVANVVTVDQI